MWMSVEILVPVQWMSLAILGRMRQVMLLSILTELVNCKLFRMKRCPETQMQRIIYPQMCLKGSGIGIHQDKQNCPPESIIVQNIFMCTSRLMMDDKSTASHLASVKPCVCAKINDEFQQSNSRKGDQHKDCTTTQQQRNRHDSNKIPEYLDSGKIFEVNFVTLHSFDIGIVAHKSGNVDMQNS